MKYPFSLDKRKIIVFVTIQGFEIEKPFKFILDTGASKSIIDETVAVSLGFDLKKLNTERLTTIGGGKNSKSRTWRGYKGFRIPKYAAGH